MTVIRAPGSVSRMASAAATPAALAPTITWAKPRESPRTSAKGRVSTSSHRRARVGHAATQAGSPLSAHGARAAQRSHLSALRSDERRRDAIGQTMMHIQQPTQRASSQRIAPVSGSFANAPLLQANTHSGSSHWRHCRGIPLPPSSAAATRTRWTGSGRSAMAPTSVFARECSIAQASSHDRQARHLEISQVSRFTVHPFHEAGESLSTHPTPSHRSLVTSSLVALVHRRGHTGNE